MCTFNQKHLTLQNELRELNRLALWIEEWADLSNSPDLCLAVQVCLEEAVAKVIMYGAANDDTSEISVNLGHCDGMLVARIEDNGRKFDPTQAPPLPVAKSLQEARVGNVGIHLMRSFADRIDYEYRDGRNRLTLQFLGPRATSASCWQ
jgi:serine/threonine-protein kinase RsbW